MSPLLCPLCASPVSSEALPGHLRQHLNFPSHRCGLCPTLFFSAVRAQRHFDGPLSRHPGREIVLTELRGTTEQEARLKEMERLARGGRREWGKRICFCAKCHLSCQEEASGGRQSVEEKHKAHATVKIDEAKFDLGIVSDCPEQNESRQNSSAESEKSSDNPIAEAVSDEAPKELSQEIHAENRPDSPNCNDDESSLDASGTESPQSLVASLPEMSPASNFLSEASPIVSQIDERLRESLKYSKMDEDEEEPELSTPSFTVSGSSATPAPLPPTSEPKTMEATAFALADVSIVSEAAQDVPRPQTHPSSPQATYQSPEEAPRDLLALWTYPSPPKQPKRKASPTVDMVPPWREVSGGGRGAKEGKEACQLCDKLFARKHFRRHALADHYPNTGFRCGRSCDYKAKRREEVLLHQRRVHGSARAAEVEFLGSEARLDAVRRLCFSAPAAPPNDADDDLVSHVSTHNS